MHFSTISLASALIALGGAIPTFTERSTDFCPGQSYLTSDIACSSGFTGCVAYEKASEICNGQKRFINDCSAGPELGSFFNCANGFKGCTTNPNICNSEPAPPTQESCAAGSSWYICASNGFAGCSSDPHVCDAPQPKPVPEDCPKDSSSCGKNEGTYYVCANGFRGYSTDPHVCDSAPISKPERPVQECAAGEAYYVCAANGFRGCSADPRVCDSTVDSKPKPQPQPQPEPQPEPKPEPTPMCPKGTWYVRPNECTSGFVGCTGADSGRFEKLCGGEKQFWGSCPTGHGNYYNCANGFVGCTTDVGVCDKKGQ